MHRLGLQAQMTAHRDAARDQKLNAARDPCAALELDHLRARSHQPRRAGVCLFRARLVASERHVGDHECRARARGDAARVIDHLVERDWQRRRISTNDHAQRVSDEQRVDAGAIEQHGEARVIAGEHRDLLSLACHGREAGDGTWRSGCGHCVPRLKNSRRPRMRSMCASSNSK